MNPVFIFLVQLFSFASDTGQLREGGHPLAIQEKRRAGRLAILVEKHPSVFAGIDVSRLRSTIETSKIFVICKHANEWDKIREEACGRAEEDLDGKSVPVVAAAFHVGRNKLYLVEHIWTKLSAAEKAATLAHEYFEMIGAEGNDFRYSAKIFDYPEMSKPVYFGCDFEVELYSINADPFELSTYKKAVAQAQQAFADRGYQVRYVGNLWEIVGDVPKPKNKGRLVMKVDLDKSYFPETWTVSIQVAYIGSSGQLTTLFQNRSKRHKKARQSLREAVERSLPSCIDLVRI